MVKHSISVAGGCLILLYRMGHNAVQGENYLTFQSYLRETTPTKEAFYFLLIHRRTWISQKTLLKNIELKHHSVMAK